MTRQMSILLYIVVLVAVVVSVDFLFLRNRFWERLIVNIVIVLVFAAFYLSILRNPVSVKPLHLCSTWAAGEHWPVWERYRRG